MSAATIDSDRVIMPRALTAENGAKYHLSGEFFVEQSIDCPECVEDIPHRDDCPLCNNTGIVEQQIDIPWTTIKEIYTRSVKLLAVEISNKIGDIDE